MTNTFAKVVLQLDDCYYSARLRFLAVRLMLYTRVIMFAPTYFNFAGFYTTAEGIFYQFNFMMDSKNEMKVYFVLILILNARKLMTT